MKAGARSPQGVFEKHSECRYFLVQMADYESAGDVQKLLYCLSAFLSAFRSIAFRLYGVTEMQHGKTAKRSLRDQLHAHPKIGFLVDRSNVEIHEDGVKVWQRFHVSIGDSTSTDWPSRWNQRTDRWASRFEPRFHQSVQEPVTTVVDWQFDGYPSNLIELCYDALNDMDSLIRQNISIGPQVP
jgi:hypothetical protein